MKEGYEKLEKPWTEYIQIFRYQNSYFSAQQLMKITKDSWTQTNQTKYRKLREPEKWEEINKLYGVEVLLAAPLSTKHLIVTNGDVLLASTLSVTDNRGKSTVYYTDNGKVYKGIYRANIVFNKFIDSEFPILTGKVHYIDGNMNNADISNIDYLDSAKRRRGAKRTKIVKIGNDADSNKYCY